jgi:hypothetical protein
MADIEKTYGGLVMTREENEHGVRLTLTCATHFRDWKVVGSIAKHALEAGSYVIRKNGVERSDRGAILLADLSAFLMREARHSLKSCRCASPLFDDTSPCDKCARAMYGLACDEHSVFGAYGFAK